MIFTDMSASDILRTYIRELIRETNDRNPRVGTQLVGAGSSSDEEKNKEEDEKEVDEMSVTANIAGPMLPLGMKTPGKKKKPGWG